MEKILRTLFATAERASLPDLQSAQAVVASAPCIAGVLDAVPISVMFLNKQRQIVYTNKTTLRMIKADDLSAVVGKRPGEALNCKHSDETTGGCGTTEFCETCGAVKAILSSIDGNADVQECRITIKPDGEALDLRVWATPFEVEGLRLTIFAVMDISDEKRRRALERIFFHDILNTAAGIKGFSELLKDADAAEAKQYQTTIFDLSKMIVDEINSQRMLAAAENNELTLKPVVVSSMDIIKKIVELYRTYDVAHGRTVAIDTQAADVLFTTDHVLLLRVLGNMTKNALEASKPGETVTLGCVSQMQQVQFWVHNPAKMPRDIQMQVFQRSFSTKGSGRGLGTYSIKLLTEKYLKGSAAFVSSKDGTIFRVSYPCHIF